MTAVIRSIATVWALAVAMLLAPPIAGGQSSDYFQTSGQSFSFQVDKPRSKESKILIASLFGGAVVFGGVGALFHLRSKNKADAVSTKPGVHTGKVYSEDLDDIRAAGELSRKLTIASYAIGSSLLIGTLVAYIVTDPGRETIEVGEQAGQMILHPTVGGAVVGGRWQF